MSSTDTLITCIDTSKMMLVSVKNLEETKFIIDGFLDKKTKCLTSRKRENEPVLFSYSANVKPWEKVWSEMDFSVVLIYSFSFENKFRILIMLSNLIKLHDCRILRQKKAQIGFIFFWNIHFTSVTNCPDVSHNFEHNENFSLENYRQLAPLKARHLYLFWRLKRWSRNLLLP